LACPRGIEHSAFVGANNEAFFVLSGELTIEFEGASHRVPSGGFFFGARNRRHAIRNVGDRPAHACSF
jgi:quercetin dioxygenase-like cupin family protein